jgi:hypothetical protein
VQTFLRIGTEPEASHEASNDLRFRGCRSIAAATAMQWSHSTKLSAGTTAMPSLQELHAAAGVNKLPTEEFEDMSQVYSTAAKR